MKTTLVKKDRFISTCRPLKIKLTGCRTMETNGTRLNAFARSCFLTHPRSPRGDTIPDNRCWQTADRWNSQFFNRIVHRRLWVKVHQIFHTCRAPRGTVYRESLTGGYSRKFWENRQKPGIFALVHAKARTVFTSGSKVKVECTPCRPLSYGSTAVLSVQKFASFPEL